MAALGHLTYYLLIQTFSGKVSGLCWDQNIPPGADSVGKGLSYMLVVEECFLPQASVSGDDLFQTISVARGLRWTVK